jgi:hypothetical protein
VHRTTRAAVLGAVAFAAALGLGGCGEEPPRPPSSIETLPPITKPPTVAESQVSATMAPLPPPNALTDVLARVSDANIPGAEKLDAIESATPADGAAMDKFGQALRDGGYAPATFEAKDLRWTDGKQVNVLAVVTIKTANPAAGDFTFPMEFRFADNHWQLTRRTADALLHLGQEPVPPPPR